MEDLVKKDVEYSKKDSKSSSSIIDSESSSIVDSNIVRKQEFNPWKESGLGEDEAAKDDTDDSKCETMSDLETEVSRSLVESAEGDGMPYLLDRDQETDGDTEWDDMDESVEEPAGTEYDRMFEKDLLKLRLEVLAIHKRYRTWWAIGTGLVGILLAMISIIVTGEYLRVSGEKGK